MSETNIRPVRETQTKNEIVNGSRRVLKRSRSSSPVTTRASEAAEEGDVESSLEAASLCPIPSFDYDASRSGSHNSSRAPVSMKVRHRGDIPPRNASTSSVSSSSRSNLFPSDDRCGSRSSSRVDSSTFRPSPSRHGNSSRSRIPTNASSLFGAVMQQVQSEALPADDPRSYPTASPAPQTPQPHHHNMHTNVHDFLNSFQSPFFVPDERDSASTPVPLTPRTPQNDPQWRETRLDQFVTDWSLHTRVHLAGQPHLSVADTNRYSHQGIQHFTLYSQSYGSNGGPPVAPPVRWEAARCYWQYPVEPSNPDISTARVQPLATTAPLQDTSQDNTRRGTGSKLAPDQFFAQPFTDPTASRNPTVGIRKPYASNPKRTIPLEREWQQAFQSLYHTWLLRIRAFNQLLIPHRDPSIVPHCYFYAVHPSRAVLFRTRLILTEVHDHKVGDSEESVDGLTLQPEILVSQSTRAMRDFLRSHEIRFAPVDIHGVFPENDDTHANLDGKFQNTVASPGTKADLEALRRAQVSGKTVGADVSVVRKPRSAPLVMDDPAPHALLIAGHDDCAAAADLCFNTLGHWGVSPRDRTGPLPKLLARGLGPFAHASLQSLRVIKNRGLDHTVESLEIQGYVLPCALPNLVQAIVAGLRSDQAHGRNASEAIHPHQTNLVGSHHVVLQTTALHSPPSTAWLNCKILPTGFDRGTVPQCRNGQRLEMAVWDIQKPATLAYKLEQTRLF